MRILGVIPARYYSQRMVGKVLLPLAGKPILQHVYERASQAQGVEKVIIATDDMRVMEVAEKFGAAAMLTKTSHTSGTERTAEVAEKLPYYDAYINIQGDEPFVSPQDITTVARLLKKHSLCTLVHRIRNLEDLYSDSVVKVALASKGRAMYFSRSAIPYPRGEEQNPDILRRYPFYKHIGIYGYHRQVLLELVNLSPSPLEAAEKLEQLRWLHHGYTIYTEEAAHDTFSIDTEEDYQRAQRQVGS
ncbi:MAG: 3-deoxy-manno-octulosonate cytidylyltransferase [Bacteroidia bacterium]